MNKNFYITTSIAYTNSVPHIGYALELVQADVLARYHRLSGEDVFFLTGTDDHGIKIQRSAQQKAISPEKFVAGNIKQFKKLIEKLQISNDDFVSTSDRAKHWSGAKKLWKQIEANGDIYKKNYKGLYCVGCEAFKKESDLVDGKCPDHKCKPEEVEEENYFFRLTKYSENLHNLITHNKINIIPRIKKQEVLNMLEGIGDVSFSRSKDKLSWGIPVPGDETQVMYVWCDALSNYLSALGYGKDDESKFEKFWPAQIHCIGKDIIKFHTIFWPAMLMSAKLALPETIFVHGHITSDGQKMSKSLGNVIDPFEIINKYGSDALRYYLLREIASTGDGDFSLERFEELYNTELANELGNLVNRVIVMSKKYNIKIKNQDAKVKMTNKNEKYLKNFEFAEMLKEIWKQIKKANQYIENEKPWELAKNDQAKLREVLEKLLNDLEKISHELEIFLPETTKQIKNQLHTLVAEPLFPRIK